MYNSPPESKLAITSPLIYFSALIFREARALSIQFSQHIYTKIHLQHFFLGNKNS